MSSTSIRIAPCLQNAEQQLSAAHIPSARLDTEVLLAHALGVNRTWLHAHADEQLTTQQISKLQQYIEHRLQREPIAYIVGHKEFYGRELIVTPDVLIPRPESETMIDLLKSLPISDGTYAIDVGTGSGCLGITVKLELPDWEVTLSDISPEALAVAKKNAARLDANVTFFTSDLLAQFKIQNSKFDIILANLPYVDTSWERSPETDHEPALALFADDNGLALIKKLIIQAGTILQPGGYLLLEADPEQHAAIITHGQQNGLTRETVRDYIVVLQKQ